MSDKSPHKSAAKKPGKSIKEKRAEKRSAASEQSAVEQLNHPRPR